MGEEYGVERAGNKEIAEILILYKYTMRHCIEKSERKYLPCIYCMSVIVVFIINTHKDYNSQINFHCFITVPSGCLQLPTIPKGVTKVNTGIATPIPGRPFPFKTQHEETISIK